MTSRWAVLAGLVALAGRTEAQLSGGLPARQGELAAEQLRAEGAEAALQQQINARGLIVLVQAAGGTRITPSSPGSALGYISELGFSFEVGGPEEVYMMNFAFDRVPCALGSITVWLGPPGHPDARIAVRAGLPIDPVQTIPPGGFFPAYPVYGTKTFRGVGAGTYTGVVDFECANSPDPWIGESQIVITRLR